MSSQGLIIDEIDINTRKINALISNDKYEHYSNSFIANLLFDS
jgi:hypothetical protein